jgi:hypothetical protein
LTEVIVGPTPPATKEFDIRPERVTLTNGTDRVLVSPNMTGRTRIPASERLCVQGVRRSVIAIHRYFVDRFDEIRN